MGQKIQSYILEKFLWIYSVLGKIKAKSGGRKKKKLVKISEILPPPNGLHEKKQQGGLSSGLSTVQLNPITADSRSANSPSQKYLLVTQLILVTQSPPILPPCRVTAKVRQADTPSSLVSASINRCPLQDGLSPDLSSMLFLLSLLFKMFPKDQDGTAIWHYPT